MEVAIVASFPAKRYVNVDACHILCFATKKGEIGLGINKSNDCLIY